MNFADLKEQLVDRVSGAWSQFEESSTYASLRERYDNLSHRAQKLVAAAAAAALVLILLLLPYSYFSSSSESIDSFEKRKGLIKELFRSNRAADAIKNAPQPISGGEFQSRLQAKLPTLALAQDQIGPVAFYDNALGGKPVPSIAKIVVQQGASVAMKSLNLRQVVEIGYQLSAIDASARMVGLDVVATASNPHYFDVTYKFASFAIPAEPEPISPPAKGDKAAGKPARTGR